MRYDLEEYLPDGDRPELTELCPLFYLIILINHRLHKLMNFISYVPKTSHKRDNL